MRSLQHRSSRRRGGSGSGRRGQAQHPPPRRQRVPAIERPRDGRPLPRVPQGDGRGVPAEEVPVPLPHRPAHRGRQLGEKLAVRGRELLQERRGHGGREAAEARQRHVAQRREADERERGGEQSQELLVRGLARGDPGEEAGLGPLEDVAMGFGAESRER